MGSPRFVGRQGKGRMRHYREIKRIEAEIRNEEYQAKLRKAAVDGHSND